MAGDEITATTQYYYKDPVVNTTAASPLATDALGSLIQALMNSTPAGSVVHGASANIQTQLSNPGPFQSATAPDNQNAAGNTPKAYLTVLFFDERFNFVSEGTLSERVNGAGNSNASLTISDAKAPKNGYAYVYVSNESIENVYFDNLQVKHERGRIIEENHYYAYGLKIAGISSNKLGDDLYEGYLENKNEYNDKELIDEGDLDLYDLGFRIYDPQTGRFLQIDPLTDGMPEYSPYLFAGNDPILNIDEDGLDPFNAAFTAAGTASKDSALAGVKK